jgi:hypothetical protein
VIVRNDATVKKAHFQRRLNGISGKKNEGQSRLGKILFNQ